MNPELVARVVDDRGTFGQIAWWTVRSLANGHVQQFGQGQRAAVGCLGDLFAAAEAVRYDHGVPGGGAHGREQHALANSHRDVVVVPFEPERTRHAAASGLEDFVPQADSIQYLAIGVRTHHRLVMTVAMDKGASLQPDRCEPLVLLHEKLRQRHRLGLQPECPFGVFGKRFTSSSRKTLTQLGSRPMIGIPARISSSSDDMIVASRRLATESSPKS